MNLTKAKTTELNALVQLLDDPDLAVYNQVEERILNFGEGAIDLLEEAFKKSHDLELTVRIEALTQKIQFKSVYHKLEEWKVNGQFSLFDAAIIVASMHYSRLDTVSLRKEMDRITRDVWLEMNEELTPLERVQILNHIFFEIYAFSGNKGNLSSPANSIIKDVLDEKKGNSVSLSILYLEIARRLNMPIYGIDLPQNFVLAYVNNESVLSAKHRVLFYINPFNKGVIFTKKDIDNFLKQINEQPKESYYQVCDNASIIRRLLAEISESFSSLNQTDTAENYIKLSKALD